MEGAKRKIETLIEAGKAFSYGSFAVLEPQRRWATSLTPAWVSWTARVEGAIRGLFDKDSAPVRMLQSASEIQLIGNGPDKFEQLIGFYMGALDAAREVLAEDTFGEIAGESATAPMASSNRIFIVHGHDEKAKNELEILLAEMGLEPVVLHRQADGGKTLIEKFEHYADVGFAFVLLTPDEIAYLVSESSKSDMERAKEHRARPNAIFEFGFFVGRLGRSRTCCIYKSPVTVPSDLNGLIYKRFERSIEEVAYAIGKELKAAGYKLK
jgi:predicted nucleotide-binding protein